MKKEREITAQMKIVLVAVSEFNATGLLALIGIARIVLAVTVLASRRKR